MEKTKNIPKIRFKGYKDEWEKDTIDSLGLITTGTTPSTSIRSYYNGNRLFASPADIYGQRLLYRTAKTLSDEGFKVARQASAGDSLFVCIGATIGKIIQTNQNTAFNQQINAVSSTEEFDKNFVYSLLNSNSSKIVSKNSAQTMPILNKSEFSKKEVFLTLNYEEQKQIGSLFKNLDEKLEIEREKHEKLVNFKKAMLENAFPKEGEKRPKIRFGSYNDDWEETQLNNIGKKYTSLTGKTKEDFGHGEGRYITFTNILANPVALLEGVEKIEVDKRQNDVKNGDLFFNISSETYEEVGMSSVWTYDKENYYLNSFCMGFRPSIELDSYFITYLLRSQAVRKQIMKLAQGISRINISQNKMLDIYLSIPSINEQRLIGSFFKNLDEKIQVSEEKITKIENFKKAMMDGLFV